jgi:hypothetical protein
MIVFAKKDSPCSSTPLNHAIDADFGVRRGFCFVNHSILPLDYLLNVESSKPTDFFRLAHGQLSDDVVKTIMDKKSRLFHQDSECCEGS